MWEGDQMPWRHGHSEDWKENKNEYVPVKWDYVIFRNQMNSCGPTSLYWKLHRYILRSQVNSIQRSYCLQKNKDWKDEKKGKKSQTKLIE